MFASAAGRTSPELQRPLLASEPRRGGFHEGGAPSHNSADVVTGYFGMRKISIGKAGSSAHPHILLNGEFTFQVIPMVPTPTFCSIAASHLITTGSTPTVCSMEVSLPT